MTFHAKAVRSLLVMGLVLSAPLLMASGQQPVARPPAQTAVPTFTPVAPSPPSFAAGPGDIPKMGAVTEGDCQGEFDAFVNVGMENANMHNLPRQPREVHVNAAKARAYQDGGPIRMTTSGNPLTNSQLQRNIAFYEQQVRAPMPPCRDLTSCNTASSLAGSRLDYCLLKLALSRGSLPAAPVAPPPLPKPALPDCVREATTAANQELDGIDREIERFLASPVGQQGGAATPALQVVMWGTSQQSQIIKRHCAGTTGFDQRLAELNASFTAAREACQKIQTRPEVCKPVAPSQLASQ